LVTLGLPPPGEELNIKFDKVDVDEDILEVFWIPDCWLIVCETSLRLVVDERETARLQYREVILEAHLEEGQLIVKEADGCLSRVNINDDERWAQT
jgi:hypothetical protein